MMLGSITLFILLAQQVFSISLQDLHPPRTPADLFRELAKEAEDLNLEWDVYGDFEKESSFLRDFEKEVATEFGKEDALFVMSGGMAQSIALLVASDSPKFACHHTSHLLLHEEHGYKHLLGKEALVISTLEDATENPATGLPCIPPLRYKDVKAALDNEEVGTLILELPHREIGGKATPWEDIVSMRKLCDEQKIHFHCDGARIFEATTAYNMPLRELAKPFDSVYISFYKGLGGVSGAMLLGTKDFCEEARTWLRRFGGNLYTYMPFVLAGYIGYQNLWKLRYGSKFSSFKEKKQKLVSLIEALASNESIGQVVHFDPPAPETPIVHGYLQKDFDTVMSILGEKPTDELSVLHRVRPVPENHPAFKKGYRSYFEWSMGEGNVNIPESDVVTLWEDFSTQLE